MDYEINLFHTHTVYADTTSKDGGTGSNTNIFKIAAVAVAAGVAMYGLYTYFSNRPEPGTSSDSGNTGNSNVGEVVVNSPVNSNPRVAGLHSQQDNWHSQFVRALEQKKSMDQEAFSRACEEYHHQVLNRALDEKITFMTIHKPGVPLDVISMPHFLPIIMSIGVMYASGAYCFDGRFRINLPSGLTSNLTPVGEDGYFSDEEEKKNVQTAIRTPVISEIVDASSIPGDVITVRSLPISSASSECSSSEEKKDYPISNIPERESVEEHSEF